LFELHASLHEHTPPFCSMMVLFCYFKYRCRRFWS